LADAAFDYVPGLMIHENHGAFYQRAYITSRKAVDLFLPLDSVVEVDSQGLLAWREPDCILRKLLADKAKIATVADYRAMLAKYGLVDKSLR
jgi:hypothetical protein